MTRLRNAVTVCALTLLASSLAAQGSYPPGFDSTQRVGLFSQYGPTTFPSTLYPLSSLGGIGTAGVPATYNCTAYGTTLSQALTVLLPLVSTASTTSGAVIDCRGFSTTQTLTANIVISTNSLTILFPRVRVNMGAFTLSVTAGTNGVSLIWPSPWNADTVLSGTASRPRWLYTGSGNAISIGGSSAATRWFYGENVGVDMSGASGTAQAITLARVNNYHLVRPDAIVAVSTANTMSGIVLDGTGGFTGWGLIEDPITDNFGGAGGGANINCKTLCNANTIIGGEMRGTVAAGNHGLQIGTTSGANFVFGLDVDGFVTGIEFLNGSNDNQFFIRSEQNNTTDIQFDAGSLRNFVSVLTVPVVVVNNGAQNIVNNAVQRLQDGQVNLTFGSTPAVDASLGNYFVLSCTATSPTPTIQAPTNPPIGAGLSQTISIAVQNNSGSTLQFAPTFTAGQPGYRLTTPPVNPPNGKQVVYTFRYDVGQGDWYEIGTHTLLNPVQTPTEAQLVSGVWATLGTTVEVTLTAARLVGAPIDAYAGQRLTFVLTQGGVGAFAVTWNAAFKVTWSDTGNATGKVSDISFIYDGTNWQQDGAQVGYH